jgi:hypothetical protein
MWRHLARNHQVVFLMVHALRHHTNESERPQLCQ